MRTQTTISRGTISLLLPSEVSAGPKDIYQHQSGRGLGVGFSSVFRPLDPGRSGVGLYLGVPQSPSNFHNRFESRLTTRISLCSVHSNRNLRGCRGHGGFQNRETALVSGLLAHTLDFPPLLLSLSLLPFSVKRCWDDFESIATSANWQPSTDPTIRLASVEDDRRPGSHSHV